MLAQGNYSFGKLLCPQTEFLIGWFSFTFTLASFPFCWKRMMVTSVKSEFLILACVQLPPAFKKLDFLVGVGGGGYLRDN